MRLCILSHVCLAFQLVSAFFVHGTGMLEKYKFALLVHCTYYRIVKGICTWCGCRGRRG